MRSAGVAAVLALALALASALVGAAPAAAQGGPELGRELFTEGCATCHGDDARGTERGPSLYGAGAASADFYLRTGYMPLADPGQQPRRGDPAYSEEQIEALVAYVASLGGGPPIPDVDPERGDVAAGRSLFSERCAGCHQIAGEGGILPGGVAPALHESTATQVGEAIRVGPYLMPLWSEDLITPDEVHDIAAYVLYTREPEDPGGWGIGHIGPIPEGMVAWLIAGVGLVLIARILGERT